MTGRYHIILRSFAFLATLGLLLGYDHLPPKELDLLPDSNELAVYGDSVDGGKSEAVWVDESKISFTCFVRDGAFYRFCGLAIKPRRKNGEHYEYVGVDLRGYDNLILHLDYDGPDDGLRLFYRNTYTVKDFYKLDAEGFKKNQFIATYLDEPDFNRPTVVSLENFDIADWWLEKNYTSRSTIRRGVENIVEFGISTADAPELGEHRFTLHKLIAQGVWIKKEQLYYYIILTWLAVVLAEGSVRLFALIKEKRTYAHSLAALSQEYIELENSAIRDPLTQIYNRKGLMRAIESAHDLNDHYLFLFDIDHFKNINDTHGHAAGDVILQQFATRISNNIRDEDHFARWGGEEFILVSHHTNPQSVGQIAHKLKELISEEMFEIPSGEKLHVTVSIGISYLPEYAQFNQAFKDADERLYEAKRQGRNAAVFRAV